MYKKYFCLAFGLLFSARSLYAELSWELAPSGNLTVTLKTPHLLMRTITPADKDAVVALFQDKISMKYYLAGEPIPKEKTEKRFDDQLKERWGKGLPTGWLAVFKQEDPKTLIGVIVFGNSAVYGASEMACALASPYMGHGYGHEMIQYCLDEFIPAVVEHKIMFRGVPLWSISAWVHPDNRAMLKIFDDLGFEPINQSAPFVDQPWDKIDLARGAVTCRDGEQMRTLELQPASSTPRFHLAKTIAAILRAKKQLTSVHSSSSSSAANAGADKPQEPLELKESK